MNKPILCLDFDGVIHSYESGWKGIDVIPDLPVPGAIDFLLEALKQFDVQIFSSRSNDPIGIKAMQDWLKKHAEFAWEDMLDGPGLKHVKYPTTKPPAFLTIDDRAITFKGMWPSIDSLLDFKPWNK